MENSLVVQDFRIAEEPDNIRNLRRRANKIGRASNSATPEPKRSVSAVVVLRHQSKTIFKMSMLVGVGGLELPTSWSQTKRSAN